MLFESFPRRHITFATPKCKLNINDIPDLPDVTTYLTLCHTLLPFRPGDAGSDPTSDRCQQAIPYLIHNFRNLVQIKLRDCGSWKDENNKFAMEIFRNAIPELKPTNVSKCTGHCGTDCAGVVRNNCIRCFRIPYYSFVYTARLFESNKVEAQLSPPEQEAPSADEKPKDGDLSKHPSHCDICRCKAAAYQAIALLVKKRAAELAAKASKSGGHSTEPVVAKHTTSRACPRSKAVHKAVEVPLANFTEEAEALRKAYHEVLAEFAPGAYEEINKAVREAIEKNLSGSSDLKPCDACGGHHGIVGDAEEIYLTPIMEELVNRHASELLGKAKEVTDQHYKAFDMCGKGYKLEASETAVVGNMTFRAVKTHSTRKVV